ncbi:MAG: hypothetical protein AB1505_08980 [Candidatus Latescibacterota bacterium]
MASTKRAYSNARLADQVRAALQPFDAPVVSLKAAHQETVARFVERIEEVDRQSRQTPVRLRRT